jgi:hypothetical protein
MKQLKALGMKNGGSTNLSNLFGKVELASLEFLTKSR